MSGLISRVIYIFPSWNKAEEPDYYKDTVGLGYFMYKEKPGAPAEPYFCECHSAFEDSCIYMNFSIPVDSPEVKLPPEDCQIKTTYISEHIVEDLAAQKLLSGLWVKKNETYILDIDEDYFGCESGAMPLVKGGISWKLVEIIDNKLGSIICPRSIDHEELADIMLKESIETLMGNCFHEGSTNACSNTFDKVYKVTLEVVLRYFKDTPSMFCALNDLQVKSDWKDIAFVFHHMTKKHLYILLQTGFCLNTSPASYGFFQGRGHVEVCHGSNTPNETIVFLHTPKQKEIDSRMHDLQCKYAY